MPSKPLQNPPAPRNPHALAAGSPSGGTSVSFLATIDFNGQQIAINTGDVTQGISNLVFQLNAPVEVGSINDFIDWLNNQFGVPFTSAELTNIINQIPDAPAFLKSFKDAIEQIFGTSLWITVLNVNVQAGSFQLGVSFPVKLSLLGFLTLENIGIMVSRTPATGSP
jgi:hypothetical protein